MQESIDGLQQTIQDMQESIQALEMELNSDGWRRLTAQADIEFSRNGLRDITELSRIMALKNPLIKRGLAIYRLYVWGQGMSVTANNDDIKAVIKSFMDDYKNVVEFTGHQARMDKERVMLTDGNVFLVPLTNQLTGRVRLRSIPFSEINDIFCNPDDAKEPWLYERMRTVHTGSLTSSATTIERVYHPDWRYTPTDRPDSISGVKILWNQPVFHLKSGGFPEWNFGLSEIYAGIDWAIAYKSFLEDWASIVKAYRRFAFQVTTQGGKRGIAAAKAKLNSTYAQPGPETNPAPITGSTFIGSEGVTLSSVNHSNATVKAEDARRLLLMVAATFGVPETFFGDTSIGSLATAKSLDRPTELAMLDRQTFWKSAHEQLLDYVLLQAVKAPNGMLRSLGRVETRIDDGLQVDSVVWHDGIDPHIDIDFPPLVGSDIKDRIAAIVSAATLDGKNLAGTMDIETVARMLLVALGEDDVDEIISSTMGQGDTKQNQAERLMIEAARELREALNAGSGA